MTRKIIIMLIFLISSKLSNAQLHHECGVTSHQHLKWHNLGPFHNDNQISNQNFGAVTKLSANPLKDSLEIYAGTPTGGLWYTNNGGIDWSCITDNYKFPVQGITFLDVDYSVQPHKIIVGIGGTFFDYTDRFTAGIIYSNDNGITWQSTKWDNALYNTTMAPFIKGMTKVNKDLFFAITEEGIYKSDDGGRSTKQIYPNTPIEKEEFVKLGHSQINNLAYDSTNKQLFIANNFSVKYGWLAPMSAKISVLKNIFDSKIVLDTLNISGLLQETKNAIKAGLNIIRINKNILDYVIYYTEPSKTVELGYFNLNTRDISKRVLSKTVNEDHNFTWFNGVKVNESNPAIKYLCGYTLNKSTDSGANFTNKYYYSMGTDNTPHADNRTCLITKHSVDGLNDHLLIGTDGGVSFSNNGGKSFKNLNGRNFCNTEVYGVDVSLIDGKICLGSQDNGTMSYRRDSNIWNVNIMGDGYDVAYSKSHAGSAITQGNSGYLRTTNNGEAPFTYTINGANASSQVRSLRSKPSGCIYFATGILQKIEYPYRKVTKLGTPNFANHIHAFDVCALNEQIVYAANQWGGNSNTFVKSLDGGISWIDITNTCEINQPRNFNPAKTRINVIFTHPNKEDELWIGSGYSSSYENLCDGWGRVMFSKDQGASWVDESDGLPAIGISDIVLVEGSEAMFVCNNYGVYYRPNKYSFWMRYGAGLPMAIFTKLVIDYHAQKLLVSTMGRGVWEIALPEDIKFNQPLIITNKENWITDDTTKFICINRDIIIKTMGSINSNHPIQLAKGRKIYLNTLTQINLPNNTNLIKDLQQNFIFVQPQKRKKYLFF
jgi:hypothetical protein